MTEHEEILNRSFDVLAHHRRRLVLYHLLETFDGVAHHDALAEIVVNETDGMEVTKAAHRRALTNLLHVHLPRLADKGFVEIDDDENTVRLQALPKTVKRLLDLSTHGN